MIQTPADLIEAMDRAEALAQHIDTHGLIESDWPGVFRLLGKTLADIEAFALAASADE